MFDKYMLKQLPLQLRSCPSITALRQALWPSCLILKSTIASDKTRKKRKSKTLVLNFETELMHALPCFFTNNNDKEFVWNGLRISLEHSQNTDMPCRTAMCHKILPSHLNGLIYIPAILNSKTNTGWTAKRTPEWEEKAFRLSTILL